MGIVVYPIGVPLTWVILLARNRDDLYLADGVEHRREELLQRREELLQEQDNLVADKKTEHENHQMPHVACVPSSESRRDIRIDDRIDPMAEHLSGIAIALVQVESEIMDLDHSIRRHQWCVTTLGFLYQQYRPSAFAWESVELVVKVSLTGFCVFIPEANRLTYLFVVALCSFLLSNHAQVWLGSGLAAFGVPAHIRIGA